jgi:hypothetical protein
MIASAVLNPGDHFQYLSYCHTFVFLQACALYVLVVNLFRGRETEDTMWVSAMNQLAPLTFGVYLIHPIVKGFFALIKKAYLPSAAEILILHLEFVFVVTVSFGAAFLLSRTPLKKVIGL